MSEHDWPIEVDTWGCWNWIGKHTDSRDGSGIVWRGGKPYAAYRAVYEDVVGPIPDGMVLAHQCLNRRCVAPHHMDVCSKSVNERQRSQRYRFSRKRCKNGHDLERTRIVTSFMGIVCRRCNQEAMR